MIQGDFHGVIGPKTKCSSGNQFRFVVATLDNGAGSAELDALLMLMVYLQVVPDRSVTSRIR
jgi:hypothetical protein